MKQLVWGLALFSSGAFAAYCPVCTEFKECQYPGGLLVDDSATKVRRGRSQSATNISEERLEHSLGWWALNEQFLDVHAAKFLELIQSDDTCGWKLEIRPVELVGQDKSECFGLYVVNTTGDGITIPQGTWLTHFSGHLTMDMPKDEHEKRRTISASPLVQDGAVYAGSKKAQWRLVGTDNKEAAGKAAFCNHSYEPNCRFYSIVPGGDVFGKALSIPVVETLDEIYLPSGEASQVTVRYAMKQDALLAEHGIAPPSLKRRRASSQLEPGLAPVSPSSCCSSSGEHWTLEELAEICGLGDDDADTHKPKQPRHANY